MAYDAEVFARGKIHPTAIIHPKAQIGAGVTIEPYVVIGEHVVIGEGTIIHPHVYIDGRTFIGKECEIYPGASLGATPQDLKYRGEDTVTVIGDRCKIHECVSVHKACGEGNETRVGNDVLLMAYVHVAHNCIVGNNVIMANQVTLAGHVIVEDRAVIGGLTGIHQFTKIGRNCMVGGMSRISQDVPPFMIVAGNPPHVSGLNSVGIARAGIAPEVRRELKKAFRILYKSGYTLQDAVHVMEEELVPSDETEHLMRFLRNVERGICRAADRHHGEDEEA